VAFAHALENLLDLVREGKISLNREIINLLVRATDMLSDLVAAEQSGHPAEAGLEQEILAEIEHATGELIEVEIDGAPPAAKGPEETGHYVISISPHRDFLMNASEPLLLMQELRRLGNVRVEADLSQLPPLDRMDPEQAYFSWRVWISTTATMARLREVFEFVDDRCAVVIEMESSRAGGANAVQPDDGVFEDQLLEKTLSPGGAATHPEQKIAARESTRGERSLAGQTVRVDVEKVDRLVNLVGELVINQAMLLQLGSTLPVDMCPGLLTGLETLSQHLRELQEAVMAIRTQPVKSVFSRMPRLVRELSAQLGKEARLVVTGENTEIDKTVIEQLADPLTHLLRNSLDHGIETPAVRVAAGKSPQGTIHLAAEHRSGRIVIEVADDGKGIDRDLVLARARARGLVSAQAVLEDEEIDNLIFLPGFSTAESVSSISGRGVGMDVVRRNIQALGGRITLHSRTGQGSRFTLSLPLTLAILDGMIVAVGNEAYIVPLTNIVGSLRPRRSDVHAITGFGDVVALRGEYVPLIYLAQRFGVPDAVSDASNGIVVMVETENVRQIGLVVDELVGQQQVVVKSLEANYGDVKGIGGATILGNGRVALILDIAGLHGGSKEYGGPAGAVSERDHARTGHSGQLQ